MKWKIPVRWDMAGIVEVEADSLADAMKQAVDQWVEPSTMEMIDGSYELDSRYQESEIREQFNGGRRDRDIVAYPELARYDENCGFVIQPKNDRVYERVQHHLVEFSVDGERYRCLSYGMSQLDALGRFFVNNPHITFGMITGIGAKSVPANIEA